MLYTCNLLWNIIFYFIGLVAGYGVLTYLVSSWRYNKARKSLKCYYHNLKKLNSLYNDMQHFKWQNGLHDTIG